MAGRRNTYHKGMWDGRDGAMVGTRHERREEHRGKGVVNVNRARGQLEQAPSVTAAQIRQGFRWWNASSLSSSFVRIGSLVLELQAVGTDIDLQAGRLLLGLVEIVTKYADAYDQRADDQKEHVAVDELEASQPAPPWLGIVERPTRFS